MTFAKCASTRVTAGDGTMRAEVFLLIDEGDQMLKDDACEAASSQNACSSALCAYDISQACAYA